jgi:hypothetical protein
MKETNTDLHNFVTSQPTRSAFHNINWGCDNDSLFLGSELFTTSCVCGLFSNLKPRTTIQTCKSVRAQITEATIQMMPFVRLSLYNSTTNRWATFREGTFPFILESPVSLLVTDFLFLYHCHRTLRRVNTIWVGQAQHTSYTPQNKTNSMVWVRERTIPTERPPLLGEVVANFCG